MDEFREEQRHCGPCGREVGVRVQRFVQRRDAQAPVVAYEVGMTCVPGSHTTTFA